MCWLVINSFGTKPLLNREECFTKPVIVNLSLFFNSTFDKETHPHLLHTIRSILKKSNKSLFILCAPYRGDSLRAFITLLETTNEFRVELLEKYDDIVWKSHEKSLKEQGYYDKDAHYPLIVCAYWNL